MPFLSLYYNDFLFEEKGKETCILIGKYKTQRVFSWSFKIAVAFKND